MKIQQEGKNNYYRCQCNQTLVHVSVATTALAGAAYFSSEIGSALKSLSQYVVSRPLSLPLFSLSPTVVMGCGFCLIGAFVTRSADYYSNAMYNEVNHSNNYGGLIFYFAARAFYYGALLTTIAIGIMTVSLASR